MRRRWLLQRTAALAGGAVGGGWAGGRWPAGRLHPGHAFGGHPKPHVPNTRASCILLEVGQATHGVSVTVRGGHLIVGRTDEHGPDPRFRLTPLGAAAYGLSLYRNQRWEPLPYEGTLQELAVTLNNDLSAWADDWS